jgi:hypothetical protein
MDTGASARRTFFYHSKIATEITEPTETIWGSNLDLT